MSRGTAESVFWLCLLAVLFLLGTGYVEKIEAPHAPYGLPVVPLLLAAMIFTAPMTRVAKQVLDGFVLRKLGVISYGFYIYHLPCLNFIDRYMAAFGMDAGQHWFIFGLAGIVFSILISVASYLAIEKPIMRIVRKI